MAPKRSRRDADNQAADYLRSGHPLADMHVLGVLSLWRFRSNKTRLNVLPDGAEFVHSDTLGLVCDRRGKIVVDAATRMWPNIFRLLTAWLRQRTPSSLLMDFPCTSISVNHNYSARLHRDGNNAGVSLTRALGPDFVGGQLTYWPNDDGRTTLGELREKDANMVDTRTNYTLFDGRRAHRVEQFQGGERYSLVFFSVAGWAIGPRHELPDGVVYPNDESLRYFSNLIAPARGNTGSILAAFGKQPKVQILCWPRTSLQHLTCSCLWEIAAAASCQLALRAVSRRVASAFPSRVATRRVMKAKRLRNDAHALSVSLDVPTPIDWRPPSFVAHA